jgi:hypothetical protein
MKATIFLFLMLAWAMVFSQENPWTPKGENPWTAYETKSENQATHGQETVHADSTQVAETSEQKLSEVEYDQLLEELEADVLLKYQNKKDFGAGFGIGIFLGIAGIVGDGIYAASNSKREKKVVKEILSDSTYQAIPDKALTKETKKTMKNKKFAKAVAGTIVAVLVRTGVFTIIIMS